MSFLQLICKLFSWLLFFTSQTEICCVLQGAAVAYVADLLAIPVISLKAVTDIVDGNKPTVEEFLENMLLAASALSRTVPLVLNYVSGKSIADLAS